MDALLIAPCGMNCALCTMHLRDKKKCQGCNDTDNFKPAYCTKCRIKNCNQRLESGFEYCYSCDKFPCQPLKQLDKRYKTKYAMSMIENLQQIMNHGIEELIRDHRIKWTCPNCGVLICVHNGYCLNCSQKNE